MSRSTKPEAHASPETKARARELVQVYTRADRNGFPSDAVAALNAIRRLGYEVIAEQPGVVKFKYRGA
jgi:hypothetical protein